MKRLFFVFGLITCSCFLYLTYALSAKTRAASSDLRRIEREIALEHEKIDVLRAEWAILTSPDRLRHLVALNINSLELMQTSEINYGEASSIPFVLKEEEPVIDNIDANALDAILADISQGVQEKEGL